MEKIKILLVDDDDSILDSFSMILADEFDVVTASYNDDALKKIEAAGGSIQVAIIDMVMGDDREAGLKLIERINELPSMIRPVSLVFTANADLKNATKCMEAGAFSYISKGESETIGVLRQKILRAVEFQQLNFYRRLLIQDELARRFFQINDLTRLFIQITEKHNPFEYQRSGRIITWSLGVLERLKETCIMNRRVLNLIFLFYNIGKAVIKPDYIVDKPGLLTPEEWKQYKNFPNEGHRLFKDYFSGVVTQEILDCVAKCCERMDGSGFPNQVKGKDIPFLAQVIAVAMEFDAALSPKENRGLRDYQRACHAIIQQAEQKKLNGNIVEAFLEAYEAGEIGKGETSRDIDERFQEAYQQINAKQYDQAYIYCNEVITSINNDHPYCRAGFCAGAGDMFFQSQEHYKKAEDYYTQAIELCPSFAEAYYKRGQVYRAQNMYEQADLDFAVAIALVPTYLEALFARGEVRLSVKHVKEARICFDRVIALIGKIPDDDIYPDRIELEKLQAKAFYYKGLIDALQYKNTQKKVDRQKALTNYNTALELYQNFVIKYQNDQKTVEHIQKSIEEVQKSKKLIAK